MTFFHIPVSGQEVYKWVCWALGSYFVNISGAAVWVFSMGHWLANCILTLPARETEIIARCHMLEIIEDRLSAVMNIILYQTGSKRKELVPIEGKPAASKNTKINAACVKSADCWLRQGPRIFCTECDMSVSIEPKTLIKLVGISFTPQLKHISHPVGTRFTHPIHQVIVYGGVYFCIACGATTVN